MALWSTASVCTETAGILNQQYGPKDGGACSRIMGPMLSADKRQTEKFTKTRSRGTGVDDDQVMGDVEEESDDVIVDDVNIEHASNPNYSWNPHSVAERREALVTIMSTSVCCIITKCST
jgi:hypothetical protein